MLNSRSRARRLAAKAAKILKEREDQLGRDRKFRSAMDAIKKLEDWMLPARYENLCDTLIESWGVSREMALGEEESEDDA